MRCVVLTLTIFAVFGAVRPSAVAFARTPDPQRGMDFPSVLAMCGPPVEKSFLEIRRHQIWRYEDLRIVFLEGLVSSTTRHGRSASVVQAETQSANAAVAHEKSIGFNRRPRDAKRTAALLRDIMKEIPSEQDSPGGSADSPPGAGGGVRLPVRPIGPVIEDE